MVQGRLSIQWDSLLKLVMPQDLVSMIRTGQPSVNLMRIRQRVSRPQVRVTNPRTPLRGRRPTRMPYQSSQSSTPGRRSTSMAKIVTSINMRSSAVPTSQPMITFKIGIKRRRPSKLNIKSNYRNRSKRGTSFGKRRSIGRRRGLMQATSNRLNHLLRIRMIHRRLSRATTRCNGAFLESRRVNLFILMIRRST